MADVDFEVKVMGKYRSKLADAKERGIEFDLSYQSMRNLMLAKNCAYTGLPLTEPVPGGPRKASDRTIDRVDATRGYVKGNVVACCHAVNHMKGQVERSIGGTGLVGLKMVNKVFNKTIKRIEKNGK